MKTKICMGCGVGYTTDNYRKKFCTRSCAATYNNVRRDPPSIEQKKKISQKLTEYYKINPSKTRGLKHARAVGNGTRGKYKKNVTSLLDLSSRTVSKILRRINLECCICGWKEDSIDLHHIIPRKEGGTNDHSNLTAVCPNHHRLAHAGKIDRTKFITLQELLEDNWKEHYFG